MTLDLAADQDVLFSDFGEPAIIRPAGLPARGVDVVVNRDAVDEQPDGGARMARRHLMIKNSSSKGLTPAEATKQHGGDVPDITFFENQGDDEAITKPINRVLRQNAGVILVEVLV